MQLSDDEKQAILGRIAAGPCTDEDQQILRQLLLSSDAAFLTELIKYNVRIENGRDIHIGDNVRVEFNEQAIVQVLKALHESGWHGDFTHQHLEVLETVNLNSGLIERVNQRLQLLKELRDQFLLSENQNTELEEIQRRVRTINQLNQNLKLLEQQAKLLLQGVKSELSRELKGGSKSQEVITRLSNQLEAVSTMITGLNIGKQGSQWIAQSESQLKKTAVKRALNQFHEIRDGATSEQLNDFEFSIEQFLQQIVHALEWGDYSIFDAPEIPLTFNNLALYICTFQQINKMLPRQSLPAEIIEQIEECLEYLIESLPRVY